VTSASANRIHTNLCGPIWGISKLENGFDLTGVVNTSVTLIGGDRGAGKSTLMNQLLDEISISLGRESLYIACEEAREEIKLRADRLKLQNSHLVRIVEALSGASNIADLISIRKPCAVALDSLRGMVGDDKNDSIEVCKRCKVLAVENHCPIFILQHVTKDEQIAGSNDDQHEVDTVMTFFPEHGDVRLLEVQKNRFGRAFIGQRFLMTPTGLRISGGLVMPGEDEDDD